MFHFVLQYNSTSLVTSTISSMSLTLSGAGERDLQFDITSYLYIILTLTIAKTLTLTNGRKATQMKTQISDHIKNDDDDTLLILSHINFLRKVSPWSAWYNIGGSPSSRNPVVQYYMVWRMYCKMWI